MYEEGYQKALELLHVVATPEGFLGSEGVIANYKRIWTRDAVIDGLAALLSGDAELIRTFRATLITIFKNQHVTGFLPSNVDPYTSKSSYGGTVGRADANSWAIIGLCNYCHFTGDDSLVKTYQQQVEKAFAVLDAWEYNGRGLIYVPQSGDWADEYIQHGYILYDQLLRVWALECAGTLLDRNDWLETATKIRGIVLNNFWNTADADLYAPNLKHQLERAPMSFWFLGFNPARIYPQFDLQANSLALLLDLGTDMQEQTLLELIREFIAKQKFMLPSFFPSIEKDDPEMDELVNNYAYEFRNHPHEFHNGGLWPVWNGFLAAALQVKDQGQHALLIEGYIEAANTMNHWEMNECFHGVSQLPIGVKRCAWSSAGAIIAHQYNAGARLFIP